jgi:hypothetical protein
VSCFELFHQAEDGYNPCVPVGMSGLTVNRRQLKNKVQSTIRNEADSQTQNRTTMNLVFQKSQHPKLDGMHEYMTNYLLLQ